MGSENRALIVGATGVAGTAVAQELTTSGYEVWGLSRGRVSDHSGVRMIQADLSDPHSSLDEIRNLAPTHIFYTAWKRHDTEEENVQVNGEMVRRALEEAGAAGSLKHVGLLTGLKQYIGPPEIQGKIPTPDTPFLEDEARLPVPMFYYAQEDELFRAAEKFGFSWSVHRAHTIVGFAVGNAMNIAATIGAQAAISKAEGKKFKFPGSEVRWNGLGDMTDAGLLAEHMRWAAETEAAKNTAFNVVNGDVFRWRVMWPKLAAMLEVDWEGFQDEQVPLQEQMKDAGPTWKKIAEENDLVEDDIERVAAWWHADGDLGRGMEMLADMTRSREAGFTGYISTEESFRRAFHSYQNARVLPVPAAITTSVPADR